MHKVIASLVLAGIASSAYAAEVPATSADAAVATPREAFLAAAIGAMMVCSLTSFFLSGRVSERTHVALATLAVLIGGFGLFTLFGFVGNQYPIAGSLVVLGLIGLFKLMNQLEIRRKSDRSGGDRLLPISRRRNHE